MKYRLINLDTGKTMEFFFPMRFESFMTPMQYAWRVAEASHFDRGNDRLDIEEL